MSSDKHGWCCSCMMSVDLVPWYRAVSSHSARLSKLKIITKAVIAHFAAAQHAAAAVLTINKRRGWLFAFVLRLNFELSHSNVTVLLFVSFVLFCHFRFNFFYILRLKRYSCSFSVYFFILCPCQCIFYLPILNLVPHFPLLHRRSAASLIIQSCVFHPCSFVPHFSLLCILLLHFQRPVFYFSQKALSRQSNRNFWHHD